MKPSEQIALWADMLRDMSASGLQYAPTIYDHDRYERIQNIAIRAWRGEQRAYFD